MKIATRVRKARIELIPLLDMIFLVLVSFVYTFIAMTVQKGIPVKLPYAKSALENKTSFVVVSITDKNELYFDKQKVSMEELTYNMSRRISKEPDVKVFLNADKKVFYDKVVRVMDAMRKSGADKISLQTAMSDE